MGQERQSLEQALGADAAPPLRRPAPWWKWVLSVGIAAGLIALLAYGFTRSPKDIPSPLVYPPPTGFPPAPPGRSPPVPSGAPGEGRGGELLGVLVLPGLLERGAAPAGRLGA